MISKIKISADLEVVTGLHIGGGGEVAMIGAIDSPVVRDIKTHLPIIPGSSLKGKMRSLLAKDLNTMGQLTEHNQDHEEIKRLFGSSEQGNLKKARLQFIDCILSEQSKKEMENDQIPFTETKFENSINRKNAVANPRQIERVTRGSVFNFELIYNVEEESEVEKDFENIEKMIKLLEYDYLGGGGTRGNGRVKFNEKDVTTIIGDYDSSNITLD